MRHDRSSQKICHRASGINIISGIGAEQVDVSQRWGWNPCVSTAKWRVPEAELSVCVSELRARWHTKRCSAARSTANERTTCCLVSQRTKASRTSPLPWGAQRYSSYVW